MRKLNWYLARLSSMSLPEMGYRLQHEFKRQVDRRRTTSAGQNNPHTLAAAQVDAAWLHFRQDAPPFYFDSQLDSPLRQQVAAHFAAGRRAAIDQAEACLLHRMELFGREVVLAEPIPWQADPISGRAWPDKFWADIDTRDAERAGGVKWVWELNRHHHWVTLGKAYFLTGDERFAAELCAQWQDWIAANPVGWGVNWTSPLEMALRIVNWSWALAYIRHAAALTQPLFTAILAAVDAQATHIARYLSAYSSANNHLIGEAAGLAMAGLVFPWLPNAVPWRTRGMQILERELAQIYDDGVPAEQAIHYLLFVLDFNLMVWRLAELNGLRVPPLWATKLAAAGDFLQHLMDRHGGVPAIGDSDDAWVVRLDDRATANNFRSVLASTAVICQRADFKAAAAQWDEKSHWLLGEAGRQAFDALPSAPVDLTSKLFATGGYSVLRAGESIAVFDHGPLGYLATAAHGHADALSVTLCVRGEWLLVDPGTYAYQEGGAWRTYLRSSAAHNTVVVDDTNQSELQGTFLWGRKAQAKLVQWRSTPDVDVVIGEHDGYQAQSVRHQRVVIFDKPHWLFVIDRLMGETSHRFEQLWHFPAGSHVEESDGTWRISQRDQSIVIVQLDMRPDVQPEISQIGANHYHGVQSPIQGWVSHAYGHLAPAPVLGFHGNGKLPVTIRTAIALEPEAVTASGAAAMEKLRERLRQRLGSLEP